MISRFAQALALAALSACLGNEPLLAAPPDLVLFVTVDQLRGDMPRRGADRFGPGGFRYLLDRGTIYLDAHFSHLLTTTAAGHATLATGADGSRHGMAANEWFDVATRQPVYNTEDQDYPVLGTSGAPHEGRSPRNLELPTFGDLLVQSSAGESRVFSVSMKDRTAIILGGRKGKAFWYSKTTGRYVTSSWYYPDYPAWVEHWNSQGHADLLRDRSWELLHDRASYVFRDQDDRSFEKPEGGMGNTFPHPLSNRGHEKDYYSALRSTPMGDEMTLSFVRAMVEAENIGSSGHTDLLAVGFSATDYIGHDFGPDSLEAEDNLLRLDRTLQQLFEFIDQRVGLDNTLIVLASDHGIAPSPGRMLQLGVNAAVHQPEQFLQRANRALRASFGVEADLALAFLKPGIYLDERLIRQRGLELAKVERELAREITGLPGFTTAFSRTDLLAGLAPDSPLARLAARSVYPGRSGNVIVVQDEFWLLSNEPGDNATTHGSPYAYDSHVPIMISGPGIGRQSIADRVSPRDVAPTLCALLGIAAPPQATGRVLPGINPE